MNRTLLAAALLITLCGTACQHVIRPTSAAEIDGIWVIADKIAVQTFNCEGLLCGKIVWLRNPALRTPEMCNRTIVWGLRPTAAGQWTGGWFFDPEDDTTYNVNASLDAPGTMTARIYRGLTIFGRTEILTRIQNRSRAGWCQGGTSG